MDTNKGEYSVALEKIVEKFQLRNLTPDVNIAPISITNSDIEIYEGPIRQQSPVGPLFSNR